MNNTPEAFKTVLQTAKTLNSQVMSTAGSKLLKTGANQAATIKVQTLSAGSKRILTSITGKAVLTTVTNRTAAQAAKSAAISNAIALPVAIVIDGAFLTYECIQMKKQLDEEKMSQESFDKEVTKKTFGSVGGLSVGFGCAVAAAAAGTAIFPGIGTAAGFGIGLAAGLGGSFAGRFVGNLAGRGVYAAVVSPLKKKILKKKHAKRRY